jgi:hypothetical protein
MAIMRVIEAHRIFTLSTPQGLFLALLKRLDFNYLTIADGELLAQISQNRENPWIPLALGAWRTPSDTSQEATTNRGNDSCVDHRLRREVLRQAIYKAMADNRVDALAYPTIRRKANLIGEAQQGTNCQFASNSGLPAIVVPGMFTSDGVPVA